MRYFSLSLALVFLWSCHTKSLNSHNTQYDDHVAIQLVLSQTLDLISGPAGPRDFKSFKDMFTPDASIGVSQDGKYYTFTPQQYEERNGPFFEENDFYEEQVSVDISFWKGIAEAKQAYHIFLGNPATAPIDKRGINYYRLVKIDDKWKIQSIVFATYQEGEALPIQ